MAESTSLTPGEHPSEDPLDDIILDTSNAPARPRFLGSALNDYRPVSGISSVSSFNESTAGSRNSAVGEDAYDPSTPFVLKQPVDQSCDAQQSYHILGSRDKPRSQFDDDEKKEQDDKHLNGIVPSRNAGDTARRKRQNFMIGSVALVIAGLIALAIILAATLARRHAASGNSASGVSQDSVKIGGAGGASSVSKLWGIGGDSIKTESGSTFVYNNTLGGTWVAVPFNDTARAQGDQPSLAEKWDYSANRILGVNLGGWLVLEPFIVPSLFESYADTVNPVIDEWTLCEALGSKAAQVLENHYNTFITEQDFAEIASAGLNWVRLPVGWWMIETWSGEPFVAGVSFKYFLKAITWARKYGLRINLDLHAVPGSQNGWNHSGRFGTIGFLRGAMGIANAQRTLNYVRTLTEFVSQAQYKNVLPMFSVLNEAQLAIIGSDALRTWYYQVYQMLRSIGGIGEGNGPFMVIHDGFGGSTGWNGFLQGADRLGLDMHQYFCFGTQNVDSVATNSMKPCQQWAALANTTMSGFGMSITGEFSLAINDCGLYVNNVGSGTRFEGTYPTAANPDAQYKRMGSCEQWLDDRLWTSETKNSFADLAQTQQDVMRNSFFWTWKIGKSAKQDNIPNPMWNYQGGLHNGYIRPDARVSNGRCASVVGAQGGTYVSHPMAGNLESWKTGGAGAGDIVATQVSQYSQFPPASISGGVGGNNYPATALPSYVATGTPVTLVPSPVKTGSKVINAGSGWTQSSDNAKWWVPQAGCNYLDPWGGVAVAAPTPVCGSA